jgi:hypothetical protein
MNIRIIAVVLLLAFIAYSFTKKFTIVPKKKVKPQKKKPEPEPEPEEQGGDDDDAEKES